MNDDTASYGLAFKNNKIIANCLLPLFLYILFKNLYNYYINFHFTTIFALSCGCITNNTLPLLGAAADDNTKREEEDGRDDTTGAEVVLNISTTVGTTVPVKENN